MPLTQEPFQMSVQPTTDAPQRPTMKFDNTPNARSKTMKTVDGPHTYGALNAIPSETGTYTIGVSEDMGARRTMEDAYSFVVDFAGIQGQGFFAIFDGHAGKHAAEWCGTHFHETLLEQLVKVPSQPIPEAIAETFLAVDAELTKLSESGTTQSGCTAVTAFLRLEDAQGQQSFAPAIKTLIQQCPPAPVTSGSSSASSIAESNARSGSLTSPTTRNKIRGLMSSTVSSVLGSKKAEGPKQTPAFKPELGSGGIRRVLYTANVGDARAVLSRGGRAVRLTYDHKGTDKREVRRIQEAGGFVLNNRVNGVLAVTRSLGDSAMKEYVVGSPYTSEMDLTDADEFLIIACDGLWDVTDDQAAVELIRDIPDAKQASETLVRYALDNFSHDNVTVLVVKFGTSPDGRPTVDSGKATA